jgi:hypothetical protein
MKQFKLPGCLAALSLAAAIATPVLAQDASAPKKDGKPDEAAMMAAMIELAKPGENHKILAETVGRWSYKVKYWMSPDTNAPPMESSGTTTTSAQMGGRYFLSNHRGKMQMPGADGKMQDMDFAGMEVAAYDNVKKKFVSSWIDNMGTGIVNSEGDYDPAAKAITYHAEYEPMPGMKTKTRQVVTLADKDHHKMEYYEFRGPAGEVKTMEIEYTRASGPMRRPPPPGANPPGAPPKVTQ